MLFFRIWILRIVFVFRMQSLAKPYCLPRARTLEGTVLSLWSPVRAASRSARHLFSALMMYLVFNLCSLVFATAEVKVRSRNEFFTPGVDVGLDFVAAHQALPFSR